MGIKRHIAAKGAAVSIRRLFMNLTCVYMFLESFITDYATNTWNQKFVSFFLLVW